MPETHNRRSSESPRIRVAEDRQIESYCAMPIPLILIPGLSASREVYEPQLRQFSNAVVPDWPVPLRGETLRMYAERFADQLSSLRPCILGGMSFGGMLAQEMVPFLQPEALILIATIRGPDELPLYARIGRRFRSLLPYLPIRMVQAMTSVVELPGIRVMFPLRRVLALQFRESDPWLFRWSLEQILTWPESPAVNVPIWHIHGDRDPILPHHRTTPSRLVAGGGHVLTLTHATEVNQFIDDCQRST